MIKNNRQKALLIFLGLFLIFSWFYWFQFRPAQIKHDCSWVKHTAKAVPAKQAMNEDELRVAGFIKTCREAEAKQETGGYQSIFSGSGITQYRTCVERNNKTIEEYKTARPAVPAKDWWVQADENEYKFCLHDKGL